MNKQLKRLIDKQLNREELSKDLLSPALSMMKDAPESEVVAVDKRRLNMRVLVAAVACCMVVLVASIVGGVYVNSVDNVFFVRNGEYESEVIASVKEFNAENGTKYLYIDLPGAHSVFNNCYNDERSLFLNQRMTYDNEKENVFDYINLDMARTSIKAEKFIDINKLTKQKKIKNKNVVFSIESKDTFDYEVNAYFVVKKIGYYLTLQTFQPERLDVYLNHLIK